MVDRCIVDKNVVIGAGTHLGWGDDYDTPNAAAPDRFNTGPTIVGKGAHIPAEPARRAQRGDPGGRG